MDAKKINIILDDFEKTNPELYYHSERVAMICYAFAQEINLSFPEREIAYFSGMLHDIGKYYLGEFECDDMEDDSEYLQDVINGSMIFFDKDFAKIIPVIGTSKFIKEDQMYKYDYNVNVIKIMVLLANRYDELRLNDLYHEKACEVLRSEYKIYNNMVTSLLKAIIKNKLNHEY